jgi:hypothetical protein
MAYGMTGGTRTLCSMPLFWEQHVFSLDPFLLYPEIRKHLLIPNAFHDSARTTCGLMDRSCRIDGLKKTN